MNQILLVLIASAFMYIGIPDALAQDGSQLTAFSNTLLGKLLIAAISAAMSLLVGYILYYIKDRKEERRRISYDVEFRKGMLGIEEERLSRDLSLTYKGREARNINYVRCTVSNSGTSVVRNQRLRFEFPKGTQILDWSVDPVPPKELGFSIAIDAEDEPNERSFSFGHFQIDQQVSLHFVVAGDPSGEVRVYGFNPEEDVRVLAGSIGAALDDSLLVRRFVFLYLLTLFAPRALANIPIFGEGAAAIYYIVVTFIALPLLPGIARIIASWVRSASERKDQTRQTGPAVLI